MNQAAGVALTTFLGAAVEVIEMVAIVTGVGVLRGWRWSLIGAGAGFVVLVGVVAVFGAALTAIPIGLLRLLVGTLLLIFGLNWLRKGIRRVAAQGLRVQPHEEAVDTEDPVPAGGPDWTAFVLCFKGVLLEGLEVAFIVVTFGTASGRLGAAAAGAAAAMALVGGAGVAFHRAVRRIPRNVLLLVVGLLLSTFGTFWAVEGVGLAWPGDEAAIPVLLALYAAVAALSVGLMRPREARPMVGSPAR